MLYSGKVLILQILYGMLKWASPEKFCIPLLRIVELPGGIKPQNLEIVKCHQLNDENVGISNLNIVDGEVSMEEMNQILLE